MGKFLGFQAAAREGGFVELKKSEDGTVHWFGKNDLRTAPQTEQRICIDMLTDSATVYSRSTEGRVDSRTFRGVSHLREWMMLDSCNDKS